MNPLPQADKKKKSKYNQKQMADIISWFDIFRPTEKKDEKSEKTK